MTLDPDLIKSLKENVGEHGYNYIDDAKPRRCEYQSRDTYELALARAQEIMDTSGYTFVQPEGILATMCNFIAWGCYDGTMSCARIIIW